jgi:uncharacterized protein YecE (DUF72 family)
MIKTVTHGRRLRDAESDVLRFLGEVMELGRKLGCVLIQLPPGAAFDATVADEFFSMLRSHYAGPAVCEPRHATWFNDEAVRALKRHAIGRVAADPITHPGADEASGDMDVQYFRLHGAPRMYYDDYSDEFLRNMAARLRAGIESGATAWCIFDNTALGHATGNALALMDLLKHPSR